ncbi:MAG: type II toxin-antitoxin system PemK/MazF family toxin [Candidatus Dormibacteraeota bacterium]|nr:type II toxin-antitoxin system PemK/MazF family toxin [Candidatus Dormibacteraeota bacterium]
MRRGEVYWVDFEPAQGSEADKIRPAVIVSSNALNRVVQRRGRGVVTVVPVTSRVDRIFPFQVFLGARDCGLAADSKAQAEQVRAVATGRLRTRIGVVPPATLRLIDDALRLHLSL